MISSAIVSSFRHRNASESRSGCGRASRRGIRSLALFASSVLLCIPCHAAPASWTKVSNPAPNYPGTMLLLTDGTVMVSGGWNAWMRLTPDAKGSYINGTWTELAPMSMPRLYFASQVLPNGEVWVGGGEYSGTGLAENESGTAETYNPVTNRWTREAALTAQSDCPYFSEFGGVTTQGLSLITGMTSTAGFRPGWSVYGTGIPSNTTIHSVVSPAEIELSQPATATNPYGVVLNFETFATGNITSGSAVIRGIPSTAGYQVGWAVYGSGIEGGSVITAINSPTSITISNAASQSANGTSIAFVVQRKGSSCIGDAPSMLLSGSEILVGDIIDNTSFLFNTATGTWKPAAKRVYGSSGEQGWVRLQNGSVLTYDVYESVFEGKGFAEIYSPATNEWSSISPADDTATGTLPNLSDNASYEIGPVLRLLDGRIFQVGANGLTALYNPAKNSWAAGPSVHGDLNGHSVLFTADDAPGAILPSGHVVFAADAGLPINSTGTTTAGSMAITGIPTSAIQLMQVYWPVSGNGIPGGAYITAVDVPAHQVTINATAATSNSNEAIVFGGAYSNPTQLFDFNPATNAVSPLSPAIPDGNLPSTSSYVTRMLMLPTGQLLFVDGSQQLWVYTPTTTSNAAYQPKVTKVVKTAARTYKLTGTQITGQSAGVSYGDDVQSDENYPIVRLVNSANKVFYARTTNWSTVEVATGSKAESVTFTIPTSTPLGSYKLILSAAGLQSAPVAVSLK